MARGKVRLQREIINSSDDRSIFVFGSEHSLWLPSPRCDGLASTPSDFFHSNDVPKLTTTSPSNSVYSLTNHGLQISVSLRRNGQSFEALLGSGGEKMFWISLLQEGSRYARTKGFSSRARSGPTYVPEIHEIFILLDGTGSDSNTPTHDAGTRYLVRFDGIAKPFLLREV